MPMTKTTEFGSRSTETDSPRTLQSIQICRGIAAMLVVLYHLGGALASPKYFDEPIFNYVFIAGGSAGVDFFFVLSGFVITSVHWGDVGDPARLPAYLYKRCVRIYPIYWIVFFCVSALAPIVVPVVADMPKDLWSLLKAAALVPQDPNVVGGTGAPVIVVAWSLQYEILFYIFFGLLILSKLLALGVGALLLAWAAAGWVLGVHVPLGFLNPVLFVLFAAGLFVGLMVRAKLWTSGAHSAARIGAAGFLVAAAIMSLSAAFPSGQLKLNATTAPLLFGASASLLIFGLVTLERRGRKPMWQNGLLLGDASYVLYLIHYPLISVLCKIAKAVGLTGLGGAVLTWAATLTVCIGAAVLVHLLIERPLVTAARGLLKWRIWNWAPLRAEGTSATKWKTRP
jgi:exopolysaccharide production protein ExoZ